MFDIGGSEGNLHACPFLGTWRALLCREVFVLERLVAICSVFWRLDDLGINLLEGTSESFTPCMYSGQLLFPRSSWFKKGMPLRAAQGYRMSRAHGCQGAS